MDLNKLLNGHVIVKSSNSGKDWGMTKNGTWSKSTGVSKQWLKKEITEQDYNTLMQGGVIDRTVRKGRGFSYVEYRRVRVELPNNIDLPKLSKLLMFSGKYEISIQFWPDQIAVFICKDGIDLYDCGGDFDHAVDSSLKYLQKIKATY